jgi:hypothetical protein
MKIAIIGGGWSGIYTAYELKKQDHDITVFEKETEIGGKCKDLLDKYPGGAIGFTNYTLFSKVLDEHNIRLVGDKNTLVHDNYDTYAVCLKIIIKTQLYRLNSVYNNVNVTDLFSEQELSTLNSIVYNCGYDGTTMYYLYQYLDNYLNGKTISGLLRGVLFNHDYPHVLETSINKLMIQMSKNLNLLTNCEIVTVKKHKTYYTIYSPNAIYKGFDAIVFTTPINKSFQNVVPKEIVRECKKLSFTKYASALLKESEFELLKHYMLTSVEIYDENHYKLCWFYDTTKLDSIPDDRKNIVHNYFPKFVDPKK